MSKQPRVALTRQQAVALMNETQLGFYKSHRTKAIVFGLIYLWTFPLFSWSTILPIALAFAGDDPWAQKGAAMSTIFVSPLILPAIALTFGRLSKNYRTKARNIRLAVIDSHLAGKEPNA